MKTRFAIKKVYTGVLFVSFITLGVCGCTKKGDTSLSSDITPTNQPTIALDITNQPVITNEITQTPAPTLEPSREGMAKSKLTGLWVKDEVVNQRPIAVMLNNITYANPQSGILDASILYEALVEGGITRLMGLYEKIEKDSLTANRLGSIRSARHYFVSFADEYDAIFLHYGQTKYAQNKIDELGIDTINGMGGVGVNSFYRDNAIKAPHNAFTSLEGINKAIKAGKYRTTYEEDYEGHFQFYEKDTILSSDIVANEVSLAFSKQSTPVFLYDSGKGIYLRNQYEKPHLDANTKEQLSFKNIIIQFVKEWDIDKNGYQTMELENASGEGYYISNGKKIDITWEKNESARRMRYYTLDGQELMMNAGKTYVAVFPNNRVNDVIIE